MTERRFTNRRIRAELHREIQMRRVVFPRQVDAGKISKREAEERIAILEQILADYPDDQKALDL